MTLQGEAAALADRYGLAVGLPAATAALLKKQMQYRYSHGIGNELLFSLFFWIHEFCLFRVSILGS